MAVGVAYQIVYNISLENDTNGGDRFFLNSEQSFIELKYGGGGRN